MKQIQTTSLIQKNKIDFHKYTNSGNNFIIIDNKLTRNLNYSKLAKKYCDRKNSIGADDLLIIQESDKADFRLRIFAPDGSESDMCGNGARCAAHHHYKKHKVRKLTIQTNNGNITAEVKEDGVEINAGNLKDPYMYMNNNTTTTMLRNNIYKTSHKGYEIYILNIGEPHAVIISQEDIDAKQFIEFIRNKENFPRGINLNIVRINTDKTIRNRTLERGLWDYTTSCATGAICASIIAREILNIDQTEFIVKNDIGQQKITITDNGLKSLAKPQHLFSGTFT